jgi:hypothetical protein
MSESDDEAHSLTSGYLTPPPLSPTKTVSTEGWTSPTTPVSARKPQSCLSFRDIETDFRYQTLPDSPTKVKLLPRPVVFQIPDGPRLNPHLAYRSVDHVSLAKKRLPQFDGSLLHEPLQLALNDDRYEAQVGVPVEGDPEQQISDDAPSYSPSSIASTQSQHERGYTGLASIPHAHMLPLSRPGMAPGSKSDTAFDSLEQAVYTNNVATQPTRLRQIPIRHASSPLRPSQWAARGGLLKSPRHETQTPDRFIPSRRPPHITRESFELNKPAQRLTAEERRGRNGESSADPFARRLRRSGRLNDELRGLRETHSVLTGRTSLSRRSANPNLRRSSSTLGTRHFSAGAIWNVGGSAAASDTVVAVSNGRGGMLGSGTNAPLYTSMFLSRSDPEAELEVYERRLALALDVDQTDRVLRHTRADNPVTASLSRQSLPDTRMKHVWKDSAWTKDGVAPSLLCLLRPQRVS